MYFRVIGLVNVSFQHLMVILMLAMLPHPTKCREVSASVFIRFVATGIFKNIEINNHTNRCWSLQSSIYSSIDHLLVDHHTLKHLHRFTWASASCATEGHWPCCRPGGATRIFLELWKALCWSVMVLLTCSLQPWRCSVSEFRQVVVTTLINIFARGGAGFLSLIKISWCYYPNQHICQRGCRIFITYQDKLVLLP